MNMVSVSMEDLGAVDRFGVPTEGATFGFGELHHEYRSVVLLFLVVMQLTTTFAGPADRNDHPTYTQLERFRSPEVELVANRDPEEVFDLVCFASQGPCVRYELLDVLREDDRTAVVRQQAAQTFVDFDGLHVETVDDDPEFLEFDVDRAHDVTIQSWSLEGFLHLDDLILTDRLQGIVDELKQLQHGNSFLAPWSLVVILVGLPGDPLHS